MEGLILRKAQMPQLPVSSGDAGLQRKPVMYIPSLTGNHAVEAEAQTPVERKEPRRLPFIESNTKEISLRELETGSVVPTFAKDNELTLSHPRMISAVCRAVEEVFRGQDISSPSIRVSHPIKGRIPEAIHKPVKDLLESDKTIFYERAMFCVEVPSITSEIGGKSMSLMIGGVRAYNEQNLNTRKSAEKFKLFAGFQVHCCSNMCVSSDGYVSCVKAMDETGLYNAAVTLLRSYDMDAHLSMMDRYKDMWMSESQFAQFLGKCRMYQFLPSEERKRIPQLLLTDTQVNLMARAFYEDQDFGRRGGQGLSMWDVYNLMTGANKSSYIDNFLDRSLNATMVTEGLCRALEGDEEYRWFIS